MEQLTEDQLAQMAATMGKKMAINTKDVLTLDEVAEYMGVSKSCVYKMTMKRVIPYYKPTGKLCYFERNEINKWLLSNRCSTDKELQQKAEAYCRKEGGRQ